MLFRYTQSVAKTIRKVKQETKKEGNPLRKEEQINIHKWEKEIKKCTKKRGTKNIHQWEKEQRHTSTYYKKLNHERAKINININRKYVYVKWIKQKWRKNRKSK